MPCWAIRNILLRGASIQAVPLSSSFLSNLGGPGTVRLHGVGDGEASRDSEVVKGWVGQLAEPAGVVQVVCRCAILVCLCGQQEVQHATRAVFSAFWCARPHKPGTPDWHRLEVKYGYTCTVTFRCSTSRDPAVTAKATVIRAIPATHFPPSRPAIDPLVPGLKRRTDALA